jgi:hypothetical protein
MSKLEHPADQLTRTPADARMTGRQAVYILSSANEAGKLLPSCNLSLPSAAAQAPKLDTTDHSMQSQLHVDAL